MGNYDTISVDPETKERLKQKKTKLRYSWDNMMSRIDELLSTYGIEGADDLDNLIREVQNNGRNQNGRRLEEKTEE